MKKENYRNNDSVTLFAFTFTCHFHLPECMAKGGVSLVFDSRSERAAKEPAMVTVEASYDLFY